MKTNGKLPIYLYMDACVICITVQADLNFTWSWYSINLWVFSSIRYILLYQCPFYHNLTWSTFSNLFVCSNFLEELEYRIKSCPAPDLNCLHGCIHLVATIAKCKKNEIQVPGPENLNEHTFDLSYTFLLYISPFVIMGHTIKFEYVLVIQAMSRFLYHVC